MSGLRAAAQPGCTAKRRQANSIKQITQKKRQEMKRIDLIERLACLFSGVAAEDSLTKEEK